MLGLLSPPKHVYGGYISQKCHYISLDWSLFVFCLFVACCDGVCAGICGWVPSPRFQPFQGITPQPSAGPACTRYDSTRLSSQTSAKPTPVRRGVIDPPTMMPTPKEEHTKLIRAIDTSTDIPSEIPVKEAIGKLRLMEPHPPFGVGHDAIPLLNSYSHRGCPVQCGEPWSRATIELLLQRGPHRSAMIKKQSDSSVRKRWKNVHKGMHGSYGGRTSKTTFPAT